MRGTKRKISMEKIEKKDSRAVAFSKRRKGLYRKASEFCLLSDSRIAILATPISSTSNTCFYSFGHSSVDSVVSDFLTNQSPREDTKLGFWWEDKSLLESEDLNELRDALDSMSKLMNKVEELMMKKKKDEFVYIPEDLPANSEGFVKTIEEEVEEEKVILGICDKKMNNIDDYNLHLSGLNEDHIPAMSGCIQEFDPYEIIDFETESVSLSSDQNLCSGYGSAAEDGGALILGEDHCKNFSNLDHEDQILTLSDNNKNNNKTEVLSGLDEDQILVSTDKDNNNSLPGDLCGCIQEPDLYGINNNKETSVLSATLDGSNQEFDLAKIFGLETKSMNLDMDDAWMMTNTIQNQSSNWDDNLRFSDVFNELDSITAL